MKRLFKLALLSCALTLSGTNAQAQSIDYGSLETLFGEPVTASANGTPQRASDAPLNMEIISAETIRHFPAQNIAEVLRFSTSLSVRRSTFNDYSVSVRGYNQPQAERLLVLVNGRQVYSDYFGNVNWNLIPVELNEIRQIEIVRGPNTALFGFNAVSGVVNIVTFTPLYDDIDVIEADAGTSHYMRGSAVTTVNHDGRLAARFSVGGYEADNFGHPNLSAPELSTRRDEALRRSVSADIMAQVADNTQLRLEITSAKDAGNLFLPTFAAASLGSTSGSFKTSLLSDTRYGLLEATIYRNTIESDLMLTAGGGLTFENDVTVMQVNDVFKVGSDHIFRLSAEYRDSANTTSAGVLDLGETSLNIQSLGALWNWQVNPQLSFSLAGRYDHAKLDFDGTLPGPLGNPFTNAQFNRTLAETGYNIGAVYKPTAQDTFRLTAAKGVDLPSLIELGFQVVATTGDLFFGNPQTNVSEVYNYELGYERDIAKISGTFKATTFYQLTNEAQTLGATEPVAGVWLTGNIGDSEMFGFDLSLDGVTENNIRWGINYTYAQVVDDFSINGGGVLEVGAEYEDLNSDHTLNAHLGYSPNEKWDLDAYASYTSGYTSLRSDGTGIYQLYDVSPQVVMDARVAYMPTPRWTVSLNGQSVLGPHEETAYGADVKHLVFLRGRYAF